MKRNLGSLLYTIFRENIMVIIAIDIMMEVKSAAWLKMSTHLTKFNILFTFVFIMNFGDKP